MLECTEVTAYGGTRAWKKKGASQEKVPRMSKFHGVGDHDDMVLVTMLPQCW